MLLPTGAEARRPPLPSLPSLPSPLPALHLLLLLVLVSLPHEAPRELRPQSGQGGGRHVLGRQVRIYISRKYKLFVKTQIIKNSKVPVTPSYTFYRVLHLTGTPKNLSIRYDVNCSRITPNVRGNN